MLRWDWCIMLSTNGPMNCKSCDPYPMLISLICSFDIYCNISGRIQCVLLTFYTIFFILVNFAKFHLRISVVTNTNWDWTTIKNHIQPTFWHSAFGDNVQTKLMITFNTMKNCLAIPLIIAIFINNFL